MLSTSLNDASYTVCTGRLKLQNKMPEGGKLIALAVLSTQQQYGETSDQLLEYNCYMYLNKQVNENGFGLHHPFTIVSISKIVARQRS